MRELKVLQLSNGIPPVAENTEALIGCVQNQTSTPVGGLLVMAADVSFQREHVSSNLVAVLIPVPSPRGLGGALHIQNSVTETWFPGVPPHASR